MGEPTRVAHDEGGTKQRRNDDAVGTAKGTNGLKAAKADVRARQGGYAEQSRALEPAPVAPVKVAEPEALDASTVDAIADGLDALDVFSGGLLAQAERTAAWVVELITQHAGLERAAEATKDAKDKEERAVPALSVGDRIGLLGDFLSMLTGTKAMFTLLGALCRSQMKPGTSLLEGLSAVTGGANAAVGAIARKPHANPSSATTDAIKAQLDVLTESVKRLGTRQVDVERNLSDVLSAQVRLSIGALARRLPRLAASAGHDDLRRQVETTIAEGQSRTQQAASVMEGARQRLRAAEKLGATKVDGMQPNRCFLEAVIAQKARVDAGEGTPIDIGQVHHRYVRLDRSNFEILEEGGSVAYETMLVSTEASELYNLGRGAIEHLSGGLWGVRISTTDLAIATGLYKTKTVTRDDVVEVAAGAYRAEVSARVWDDKASRAAWMKQIEPWRDTRFGARALPGQESLVPSMGGR
jgi:hypothetical protein